MMKHRIPDSFIQELLARVDLVDLIDSYVPLKKAGANYQACCPFHNEKTPSFTVSPTKQFYHCFGCGAHGTAFGFLMDYQGLGFIDAVHTLAMRVGLQVPVTQDADPAATSTSGDLLPIMADALGYYRDQLKKSARAIDYLKRRGLTGEIAAHFKLGYAPEGWQNLAAAFPGYANDKALQSVGLVIDSDQGRRYDRFRDRIIFPIINPRNEVIGFGGRILDKGEPKYINSPESPLFEKGRELFGLPQARNAIRKENTIIVVEGYMDVISLAQKGIENCVATLGTATTTEQVHKLLRQADQVIFCFDGDAAGRKAAWRALDNALPTLSDQKRIGFIFLPSTDDPDSLVRREGKNAFFELVRHAIPLSNHLLHELGEQHSIATAEGRSALVMAAKPLLQKLQASVLRLQIVKRLAETVRMNPDEIERVCELRAPTRVMPAKTTRPAPSLLHRLSILVLDQPRRILSIRPSDLPAGSEESAALLRIRAIVERQPDISSAALIAVLGDDPWSSGLAKELLQQPSAQNDCNSENHPDEIEFNSILDKLVGQTRLRAFAELQEKIKARGMTELSIDEKQEYLNLLSAIGKRHNIDNGTDQPLDL